MPFAWIAIVFLWWGINAIVKSRKEAEAKAALQKIQRAPQKNAAADSQPAPAPQPAAMSRADEWEDEEDSWDERDAVRGLRQPVAPRVTEQARPAQASAAKRRDAKPFEAHMHTPVPPSWACRAWAPRASTAAMTSCSATRWSLSPPNSCPCRRRNPPTGPRRFCRA